VPQVFDLFKDQEALGRLEGDPSAGQQTKDLVQVGDVLLDRPGEDNHVVQINQAGLPLDARQDHVYGPLEGGRRVRQTEMETDVLVGSIVASRGRLVLVLDGHRNLPVAGVPVQHGEDRRLAQEVDAIVHAGQGVRIIDRHVVQAAVFHAEPRGRVRLGHHHDRKGPFGLRRLDDPHLELLRQLLRQETSVMEARPVRLGPNGPSPVVEGDPVGCYINPAQLATPQVLVAIHQLPYRGM